MIAQDVERMSPRINIIKTVQTPLGFFSLAVLVVVEAILGVTANLTQGADRTYLIVVKKCGARLVVLAICDSLMLAARIAKTANMIAAIEEINDKDFLEWEEMFYKSLSQGESLSSAYEFARKTTNAEMVLLLKKDFVIAA